MALLEAVGEGPQLDLVLLRRQEPGAYGLGAVVAVRLHDRAVLVGQGLLLDDLGERREESADGQRVGRAVGVHVGHHGPDGRLGRGARQAHLQGRRSRGHDVLGQGRCRVAEPGQARQAVQLGQRRERRRQHVEAGSAQQGGRGHIGRQRRGRQRDVGLRGGGLRGAQREGAVVDGRRGAAAGRVEAEGGPLRAGHRPVGGVPRQVLAGDHVLAVAVRQRQLHGGVLGDAVVDVAQVVVVPRLDVGLAVVGAGREPVVPAGEQEM